MGNIICRHYELLEKPISHLAFLSDNKCGEIQSRGSSQVLNYYFDMNFGNLMLYFNLNGYDITNEINEALKQCKIISNETYNGIYKSTKKKFTINGVDVTNIFMNYLKKEPLYDKMTSNMVFNLAT